MKKNKEKSFIRKICNSDNIIPRTLTALIAGSIAGAGAGMFLPLAIPIRDALSKRSLSWKDTADYSLFKLGVLLPHINIPKVYDFMVNKYIELEPYTNNLIDYFQS